MMLSRKPATRVRALIILMCAFICYIILDKLAKLSNSLLVHVKIGHENTYFTGCV